MGFEKLGFSKVWRSQSFERESSVRVGIWTTLTTRDFYGGGGGHSFIWHSLLFYFLFSLLILLVRCVILPSLPSHQLLFPSTFNKLLYSLPSSFTFTLYIQKMSMGHFMWNQNFKYVNDTHVLNLIIFIQLILIPNMKHI